MRCPHTHFARGQRIRIVLMNGEVVIRRFVERFSRYLLVAHPETGEREEISTSRLRNVSIYKGVAA